MWGISCGDGWYNLIDETCEKILYLDRNREARIAQVKEKLAGLRIYVNTKNDNIHSITNCACCKSYLVCEFCGTKTLVSKRYIGFWMYTLCLKCYYIEIIKEVLKTLVWKSKTKLFKLTKGRFKS